MPGDFSHYVFVDFENVPEIDLGPVAGKPAHVTLLIGKKQTRIDLALVQQIRRLAEQVELVDVGASGRNALDLTLACYLGQAIELRPKGDFCIVSRDKDFDAMVGHLQRRGVSISRHESFAGLPFLPKARKPAQARGPAPGRISHPGKAAAPVAAEAADQRMEKLVSRLKTDSPQRPKKKSKLLAYINTAFGNKLAQADRELKLAELLRRGVLVIDAREKVSYGPEA